MKGVCFNVKRYHYCIYTDYFYSEKQPLYSQIIR